MSYYITWVLTHFWVNIFCDCFEWNRRMAMCKGRGFNRSSVVGWQWYVRSRIWSIDDWQRRKLRWEGDERRMRNSLVQKASLFLTTVDSSNGHSMQSSWWGDLARSASLSVRFPVQAYFLSVPSQTSVGLKPLSSQFCLNLLPGEPTEPPLILRRVHLHIWLMSGIAK